MSAGRARLELITTAQMRAIDAAAEQAGTPVRVLMEAAGRAVAEEIIAAFPPQPTIALCGPGANGGDGYVAARALREAGWPVEVRTLPGAPAPQGAAGEAAADWFALAGASPAPLTGQETLDGLIIDALFGAGLSRPLAGAAAAVADHLALCRDRTIAVDIPSGVPGDGTAPQGAAAAACLTVTFVRRKPGHLLTPGRSLCGRVVVRDIGLAPAIVAAQGIDLWENGPELWAAELAWPGPESHKHARGRFGVYVGPRSVSRCLGAQALTAAAGARTGAGWTSLLAPPGLSPSAAPLALVIEDAPAPDDPALARFSGLAFGPGAPADAETRAIALQLMAHGRPLALDAGALSAFAGNLEALAAAVRGPLVLTPHEGEFARLFGGLGGSKIDRARAAAQACGAVVLIKGADTVIAAPDGRAAVNVHASPFLATAGTGDVLTGMVGALLAQGLEAFTAACAGAWIHGDAALRLGPGLIADDLLAAIPAALNALVPDDLKRQA